MHALRNIHAAVGADGILVDTQPVSASPPLALDGGELGSLDMQEWVNTIDAVDERFAETIAAGLYELEHESWFVVTDTYDSEGSVIRTANTSDLTLSRIEEILPQFLGTQMQQPPRRSAASKWRRLAAYAKVVRPSNHMLVTP